VPRVDFGAASPNGYVSVDLTTGDSFSVQFPSVEGSVGSSYLTDSFFVGLTAGDYFSVQFSNAEGYVGISTNVSDKVEISYEDTWPFDWILTLGSWNDSSYWADTKTWNDGA